MKLDYLQYLELEVFTRFGARLEASMEQAIARGRVLREILKELEADGTLERTGKRAWAQADRPPPTGVVRGPFMDTRYFFISFRVSSGR